MANDQTCPLHQQTLRPNTGRPPGTLLPLTDPLRPPLHAPLTPPVQLVHKQGYGLEAGGEVGPHGRQQHTEGGASRLGHTQRVGCRGRGQGQGCQVWKVKRGVQDQDFKGEGSVLRTPPSGIS
jgi:hypothetical protein